MVGQCMQPGVSLAGMARKHGVNANLLRNELSVISIPLHCL
ncbi:MAG: hypothetical protein ACXWJZ_14360 [Burkholderiaceae bacterium]